MEYFLATIQIPQGSYTKLVLATDKASAEKLAKDFATANHGETVKKVFVSDTLKEEA